MGFLVNFIILFGFLLNECLGQIDPAVFASAPACAQACLNAYATNIGCGSILAACFCRNCEYMTELNCCLAANCDQSDAQAGQALFEGGICPPSVTVASCLALPCSTTSISATDELVSTTTNPVTTTSTSSVVVETTPSTTTESSTQPTSSFSSSSSELYIPPTTTSRLVLSMSSTVAVAPTESVTSSSSSSSLQSATSTSTTTSSSSPPPSTSFLQITSEPSSFSTSSITAALSELRDLVPVTAQQDSAAACFLLTSYSTCYTTPTWYTGLPSDAQTYFSSVNAANTAACTSCAPVASDKATLSSGAKAGIAVGAVSGVAFVAGTAYLVLKCMGIVGSSGGAGAGTAAWSGVAGAGAAGTGAGASHAASGWNGATGHPSSGVQGWNGSAGDPSSGAGWNGIAGGGGGGGGGGGAAAPPMAEQMPFIVAGGYYRDKEDDQPPNVAYQRYPPPRQPFRSRPQEASNVFRTQEMEGTGMVYQHSSSRNELGGRALSNHSQATELESRLAERTTSELSGDTVHDQNGVRYAEQPSPIEDNDVGERTRLRVRNI